MAYAMRKAAPQDSRRYKLDTISPDPAKPITLIVRHAGEGNPTYFNSLVKGSNAGRSVGGHLTLDSLKAGRLEDAERFARDGVLVGWENVTEDGKPVPFPSDNGHRFLIELIENWPDLFDGLRRWCANWDNFRTPIADPVDLGKG